MTYLLQQLLVPSAACSGKVAVRSGDRALTYGELDARSNQLAHCLRANGIVEGDRVGIYATKSLESVVAIFGILRAGAVYVPLDASAPVERVGYIVRNCEMAGLVTSAMRLARLSAVAPIFDSVSCAIVTEGKIRNELGTPDSCSIADWGDLPKEAADRSPDIRRSEDDLAYILYTSGSTGAPKGVMISHRASLTFVEWAAERLGVSSDDRLSNHAPLHFDLSVFDIFVGIRTGATVVLVAEELSIFPRELADFIAREQISIWYSVPSVLTRLVLHGGLDRHKFASLRLVLFAGEVFPPKYLRKLMNSIPNARYFNLYGPTETNVCTYYQLPDRLPDDQEGPVPIGGACENATVYVFDEHGELVAPGEIGELCVRGALVMNGYWGDSKKTREAFFLRETTTAPLGEAIYRTGDMVKQRADGNYLFLNRRDNMIKSRGYRIELGEIESALYRHPRIQEAAVVAIPDEEIGNAIKAVIVTADSQDLGKHEVEAFCAQIVPKYMIPGMIEFREVLPKTSTGKVDKMALISNDD